MRLFRCSRRLEHNLSREGEFASLSDTAARAPGFPSILPVFHILPRRFRGGSGFSAIGSAVRKLLPAEFIEKNIAGT